MTSLSSAKVRRLKEGQRDKIGSARGTRTRGGESASERAREGASARARERLGQSGEEAPSPSPSSAEKKRCCSPSETFDAALNIIQLLSSAV
ncbi:hypothetical protein AOLI_G00032290 [Acnodon oligacanthus]